jgi:arylsulfatase A
LSRPNIVFIIADDMGYGDFAVFNGGITQTPTLDRLVEEGVCLTQHYSASPVCAPARAALLTGRYPHRTGAIDTLDARGLDRMALRERTVADLFRSEGYVTGMVGKWHNGAFDPRHHPNARGFDEFAGFRGGWQDYYQWHMDRNGTLHKSDGRYLTDVLTDEAVGFVSRHAGKPFLLMLTYNAPHFPLQAPQEDCKPFAETGRYTRGVSRIYGMIRRMDAGIERVLGELARRGLAENTLVMFTSDNGPQFGGRGQWCTTRFNCNFNGCKGNVYEGGIRVPMLVRWPAGGLVGGRRCDDFVHFTDWSATLLSAADVPARPDLPLDGCDVLDALRGQGARGSPRRFWQWNRYEPVGTSNAAMRDGDWKLLRPVIGASMDLPGEELERDRATKYEPERFTDICRDPLPDRDIPPPPPPQLYNIREDPEERHDLAERHPDRVHAMLRELETWFESVEAERRRHAPVG